MQVFQTSFSKDGWEKPLPVDFDSEKTLVFVFFPSKLHDLQCFSQLGEVYKKSRILGCSGAGEIQGEVVYDSRVLVTICKFDHPATRFLLLEETVEESGRSYDTGYFLGQSLAAKDLNSVFVLSEGININGSKLCEGLRSALPSSVVISGGLAGDSTNFKNTFIVSGETPHTDRVLALGIYGDSVVFGSVAKGGWKPFGIKRTVTRSRDNILFEIDHRPALSLYNDFLGKEAVHLPASGLLFPLLVNGSSVPSISGGSENLRSIVRTLLSINEKDHSIFVAGDIPEGSSVHLMRASFSDLVGASEEAAQFLQPQVDPELPLLSLVVSCVGRRLVLGERTEDELECIGKKISGQFYQTGFYSYGELAPGKSGICDLHNQTLSLTWIQEKKAA